MSSSVPSAGRPASLQDVIALNDEIASLVRAGIPLELGLRGLGGSLSGRLGEIAERLAARMNQGASLAEALDAEQGSLPRVYRAVIEAGLRSGRLPQALESLTGYTRTVLEMRQRLGLALLYPGLVAVVAYLLFVGFVWQMVPVFQDTYFIFRMSEHPLMTPLAFLYRTLPYWAAGIPLALVLFLTTGALTRGLLLPGGSAAAGGGTWGAWMLWVPGVGSILDNLQRANFSELLSLLVEHEVPLPEAVLLAAEATGDPRMVDGAGQIAMDIRRGEVLSPASSSLRMFPPLLRWLMSHGASPAELRGALRQATEVYRRRALMRVEWFKLVMPVALLIVIGGGVTLLYGLLLFLPLTSMMNQLGLD